MAPKTAEKVAFLPLRDEFPPLSPALRLTLRREREVRGDLSNLGQAKAKADADISEMQNRRRILEGERMAATSNKMVAEMKGTTDPDALKAIDAADAQLGILTAEIEKITREQAGRTAHLAKVQQEYRGIKTVELAQAKRQWMHQCDLGYDMTEARIAAHKAIVERAAYAGGFNHRHPAYWLSLFGFDLPEIHDQIDARKAELERYLEEVPVDDA